MTHDLLAGIEAALVPTQRLTVATLRVEGRSEGDPVLFVHGNVSSSLFWQQTMLDLPASYRPIAVDLRGFGGTDPLPVDATRGLRDYADDIAATLGALSIDRVHLVGWSMGGGVVLELVRAAPERVATVTLVNPVSPYGFGATRGVEGELVDPSGAGSGGGTANPDFVERLAAGDRSDDSPTSPRQVLLGTYVKPPFVPALADIFVDSMLSTVTGDDHYPGDHRPSDVWPGVAPGTRGVLNTMAPTHFRIDDLHEIEAKPPIHWIRGAADQIVSDTSLFDLAYLGSIGVVPGWPGADVAPPQPMIAQTRAVLHRYAEAGGVVRETVIVDAGHSPHVEQPADFTAALLAGLA